LLTLRVKGSKDRTMKHLDEGLLLVLR
jgi:hypothetical protein